MFKLIQIVLAIAGLFALGVVAFAFEAFALIAGTGGGTHHHLLPPTPRSILETRRAGLA
jgi:hypothetical protein